MKQNKALKKMYEFKQLLEEKIALYEKQRSDALYQLCDVSIRGVERENLEKDYNDWSDMKNQAEAVLVFVKSQIIFEER